MVHQEIKWEGMIWFQVAQMYVYLCHIVTHISILPCGRNWTFVFASIHEQQFMLPQYCAMDDTELWFSIFSKSVSPLVPYSCLSLICWANKFDSHYACPVKHCRTLRTIFSQAVLSMCHQFCQLVVNFVGGNVFHTQKLIHICELLVLSIFLCHCHGISAFLQYSTWLTYLLIDRLTNRRTDGRTDGWTDWPTDRPTDWFLHHLLHLTLLQMLLRTQK